jgi:hypothetical protein
MTFSVVSCAITVSAPERQREFSKFRVLILGVAVLIQALDTDSMHKNDVASLVVTLSVSALGLFLNAGWQC